MESGKLTYPNGYNIQAYRICEQELIDFSLQCNKVGSGHKHPIHKEKLLTIANN
jgi:hypothetical protein